MDDKRGRGDFTNIFQGVQIERCILETATVIFKEQMTIAMPRTDLNRRQLALVCIYKAVIQLKKDLQYQYIGELLNLEPKQIKSAMHRYTDLQTGFKVPPIKEVVVHSVKHYIKKACNRMRMNPEEIEVVVDNWNTYKNSLKNITGGTNSELAAGFIIYFLDSRGEDISQATLKEIIQVNYNKAVRIKSRICQVINNN